MTTVRFTLWGIVLGCAATRCYLPAVANDIPQPPAIPATSNIPADLAEPAPPPSQSSTGIPSSIPVIVANYGIEPVADTAYSIQPVPVAAIEGLPPGATVIQSTPINAQPLPNGVQPLPIGLQPSPGGIVAPSPPVKGQANPGAQPNQTLEVVRERYPNKAIAIERHVTRDEKHNYVNQGTWTMWDPEGRMICQGDFYNGKAVGKWVRHFPVGGQDPYTGPEYDEFARPFKAEATYGDDKLVGPWTLTDAQGRVMHSWEFNDDRLNGKATAYYATGKVRTEAGFVNGLLDGEASEFDLQGNKLSSTAWQAGRRVGPTVQRYPSGAKYSEGEYYYAREDREAKYDFFKGTIVADKIDKKKPNARQGHWIWWYEDGEKMCEGEFIDGKPVGHHAWYFPSGQKEMEGDFLDGKRNGMWTAWHANGLKKSEGLYEGGREVGDWYTWKEDGKIATALAHQPPKTFNANGQSMIAGQPQPGQVIYQTQGQNVGQMNRTASGTTNRNYSNSANRRPRSLADAINRTRN